MWDTAVTLVLNAECWVDSGRLGSTRTRLDEAARRCQSVVVALSAEAFTTFSVE